jgi:hypothetical protein
MLKPISLNIDTKINQTVECYSSISKGDTLSITFKIFQNSASLDLTNQKVYVILLKPDGNVIENVITGITGNTFIAEFDQQATLAEGDVFGDVMLIDSKGQSTSNMFVFGVGKSLYSSILDSSASQIQTLLDLEKILKASIGNEVIEARGTYNKLGLRMDNIETQLSEKANDIDSNRTTTAKDVTGALNELNSKIKNSTVVNVMDYGAVGDGTTDDTDSINKAIQYCCSNNSELYFPGGKYRITSSITIDNKCSIVGASKSKSVLFFDNCNGFIINADEFSISNLKITTNGTAFIGMTITSDYNSIERITFEYETVTSTYWYKAIELTDCWYSSFEDVIVVGGALNQDFNGYGFYLNYSVNNNFESCQLLALNYCFYLSDTIGNNHYNEGITITNSTLIASNYGLYTKKGTYIEISSCIIDLIQTIGVYFELSGTGNVSNCWIAQKGSDTSFKCIYLVVGDRITISGNTMWAGSTSEACIRVDTLSNVINNNTFFKGNIGVLINGTYNVVTGNTFNLQTLYAISDLGTYNEIDNNSLSGKAINKSSNALTRNNKYRVKYVQTAVQTFTTTATLIQYDGVLVNSFSEYDTTSYKFTAKSSGIYCIEVSTRLNAPPTGTRIVLSIFKNGTETVILSDSTTNGTNSCIARGIAYMALSVGDYLEFKCYGSASINSVVSGNSNFLQILKID